MVKEIETTEKEKFIKFDNIDLDCMSGLMDLEEEKLQQDKDPSHRIGAFHRRHIIHSLDAYVDAGRPDGRVQDIKNIEANLEELDKEREEVLLKMTHNRTNVPTVSTPNSKSTTIGVPLVTFLVMFLMIAGVNNFTREIVEPAALWGLAVAGIMALILQQGNVNSENVNRETQKNTNKALAEELEALDAKVEAIEKFYTWRLNDIEKFKALNLKREEFALQFDKDKNGVIDTVESENTLSLLIKKNQPKLIEKEKEFNQPYVQSFVKLEKYINDKKSNLQLLFEHRSNLKNQEEFEELKSILEEEIYILNLLSVNALDMVVSLLEDDRITFYNLYENLDRLNIFTSNYEREMLEKLNTLDSSIKDLTGKLVEEMRSMNYNIASRIKDLSYRTEESTALLTSHLDDINSTMKVGNTLALINTYQNYKTNKRLK